MPEFEFFGKGTEKKSAYEVRNTPGILELINNLDLSEEEKEELVEALKKRIDSAKNPTQLANVVAALGARKGGKMHAGKTHFTAELDAQEQARVSFRADPRYLANDMSKALIEDFVKVKHGIIPQRRGPKRG